MDTNLAGLVLGTDLFDAGVELAVVEALAGQVVVIDQGHEDHRGLEVDRHQLTDLARALDVDAHLFQALRRTVEAVGHDGTTLKPFFGHRCPARRRGPQRFHERPVDTGQEVYLVVHLLQGLQIFLVEDAALGGLDRDAHRVAQSRQIAPVGEKIGDIRVRRRNHLLEAGVQLDLGRLPGEHQGAEKTEDDDDQAVVE